MRYSNLYLEYIKVSLAALTSLLLRAKVVVILDTGHHLTSHPTDIITLECSVKDFIMNIIQSCVLIACIEIALSKNGKGEVSCNVNKTCILCIVVNHKLKKDLQ